MSHSSSIIDIKSLEKIQCFEAVVSQPAINAIYKSSKLFHWVLQCSCCFINLLQMQEPYILFNKYDKFLSFVTSQQLRWKFKKNNRN